MKLRLTSRIVLLFVLLTAMLLATVGMLSYRSGSKSLRDAAISEMLSAAIEKEAALDTWIEERLENLGQIANQSDVVEKAANLLAAPPASEQARSVHALLLEEFGPLTSSRRSGFIELFVMEPENGKVIASTSPAQEGKSKRGHPYFDNGKTDLYLQSPYHSVDLKAPAMTATIPLRATDGRVVAVLAARVDLDALNTIAQRRTGLRQTVDSFLFNAEQFPVTQPRFISEPAVLRRKLDTEAVRLCVARHSGVTLAADYRGVPSIAIYRWNAKRQLGLIVKIDQSEALAPVRVLGWSVALISGLALLATLGISFLLARTITQPLRALHSSVRRFGEGNTAEPFSESSDDEIGLLAGEFNRMATRVVERTAEFASVNEALKAENAERQRCEESLRASQQLIEGIINAIPVRVFWKDKNLVYLGCNAVFARDAGFAEPKDLIGKDDYQMGWRDQAELYRAGDRQVIESGCPRPLVEEPQTTPEGNTITLLTSKIPLRGPKGEVSGIIGTSMDVTDRRQAEEALRERVKLQDQLVHIAASVPGMIYSLLMRPDGSTRMPYVSGALSEVFDLQPKDVIEDAAHVFSMIHPGDIGHVMATIAESARTLNPWREDFRVCHTRLGEIWVEGHSVPQREPDGSTLWHGFIQNITERKETEEELRRTSELLLRTGELAKVGGWELDLRTMKLFWSVETGRIHEVDPPVAPALDQAINFYAPEARPVIQAAVQAGIDAGAPFDLDLPLTTANGRPILVRAQGSAVMENGKAVKLIGAFQEITKRKRAELRLAAFANLGQRLNAANTAREATRIISEVADELLGWDACLFSLLSPSSGLMDNVLNVDTIDGRRVESCPGPETPSVLARRAIEAGGQLILKEKPDRMFPGSQPFGDSARPSASIMYVPARKGEEVIGVMSIQSYTPRAYDRQGLEALQALADNCGGALDRLRSEEARRRSETKFRTLYDSTSDAVMLLDQKGFFDCNPATLAMFGCATREEFCSKHPADVSPPIQPDGTDSLTLAKQHMATAMEKGSHRFEWMYKRADTGETFPAEVLLCALELDGKRVLQGSVRDITERKRSEESLRLQSAALEAVANAVVITDQNGTIQSVNPAFTALTGYTAQEAVGQNPRILKGGKQDEAFYRKLWQTISSGQVWSGETTNRRKDGSLYDEEMTITSLRNADGAIIRYIAIKQDITERKRTEMLLQASEAEFRALAEAMPQMVWITRPDGWNIYFSKQWMDYTGLTLEESLGHGWNKPFHPEDQQRAWDAWQHATATIGVYSIEARLRRGDGTYRWWLVRGVPHRDASGNILKWFGTCTDIHESKQAAEELRLTSELLLRTGELAKVGGWELDLRTMKLFWSPEIGRIHEVDPPVAPALEQAINYYAPEARPVIQAAVQAGIDNGAPFDLDVPLTTAKGRPIWVRVQGSAVMEDGKAAKLIGACQDITERKRAEETLREKEHLLSESQHLGHVGSWFHDVAGTISWSEETYRLFGVSRDTFTPTVESLVSRIQPEDRPTMKAWLAACVAGEKPGLLEYRIILPDGAIRFIRGTGEAGYDAANRLTHIAGTVQDITEHKAAETERTELHKQLIAASREAGMAEIATSVLHNVGNVLNSVNVSTGLVVESVKRSRASSLTRVVELLQEHAHDLGTFITQDSRGQHVPAHLAQLAEHLRVEQEANVRELALLRRNVDHIKEIVAMQQNYASFGGVKEMINVANLVEDSLRINEGAIIRHEVEVIREFEDVPPLNVEKHKILQILVNLLRNAKYACEDSGRTDKRLTVRVANGGGRVKISVIDNGIGIPPENLTRIFNHGFTTRKHGHGFGLHSGALAAQEMGGSLTVHSDGPGQGATFTLELPCPTPENRHE